MSIDRVGTVVIRESSQEELVVDTSMVDSRVRSDRRVAPIGELLWMIVARIEAVTADETHSVGDLVVLATGVFS